MACVVIAAGWLLTFGATSGQPATLPNTTPQFSLDHEVINTVDHDVVYVVEQRAQPGYRIFRYDPATGDDTTVFTVPDGAIVYGIDLSPDRATLAVAYSPDIALDGSGIWTLDLETGGFDELMPVTSQIYLTEPEWTTDGEAVLATHVDRTGGDGEELALAEISATGKMRIVLEGGITPAASVDGVYYLVVDDNQARRTIGLLDQSGDEHLISVGGDEFDLDHLAASVDAGSIHVAVIIDEEESPISVGEPADAHGNHNVASTWWGIDAQTKEAATTTIEPIIVYDATATPEGAIVYATLEGLSIATDERVDLITSRAVRFVTG